MLEPSTRQAVKRFVRVLARSGCSPEAIKTEVLKTCRQIPKSWSEIKHRRGANGAEHVMTLWFSDPSFVDGRGNPRPLPVRGSELSIEGLVRRVDPNLEVRQVLRLLESGGALKRVGMRYLPRDRVLIFPADYLARTLRGLYWLLGTIEHNCWSESGTSRRLQLYAFNARFPASAVGGFQKRLRPFATRLLVQADTDMHARELARRKGEPTVGIGVGVYQFMEDPPSRRRTQLRAQKRSRVSTKGRHSG